MRLDSLHDVFPLLGDFADVYPGQHSITVDETPEMDDIIARHPNGNHVAIRVDHFDIDACAAVWDITTGHVAWQQSGTTTACWTQDGRQLISIRRGLRSDLELEPLTNGTEDTHSDYRWLFERRTWPDGVKISSAEVSQEMHAGWGVRIENVAVSPLGTLATYQWYEPHASGVELVSIRDEGDSQNIGKGYYDIDHWLSVQPVFSANGEYLVFGIENDIHSHGPQFFAGRFVFLETATLEYHKLEFAEELPIGWRSRVIEVVEELDLYRRAKQKAMMAIKDAEGEALLSEMYQRE